MRWTVMVLILTVLLIPLVLGRDGNSGSVHKRREKHLSKHSQLNQISQKRFFFAALPKIVGSVFKAVPKVFQHFGSWFKKSPTLIVVPVDTLKQMKHNHIKIADSKVIKKLKHQEQTNKDSDDTQAVKMCTLKGQNEYCVWQKVVD